MMFLRQALSVAAIATATLVVAAIACSIVLLLASLIWPVADGLEATLFIAAAIPLYTLVLGLPSILLVATAYAGLMRYDQNRWYFAVALGVAPGLVMLQWNRGIGTIATLAGFFVAVVSHYTAARFWPKRVSAVDV